MNINKAKEIINICYIMSTEHPLDDDNKKLKEAIQTILNELERKEKKIKNLNKEAQKWFESSLESDIALGYACDKLVEHIGTCPKDLFGTDEINHSMLCDIMCNNNYSECWKEYFYTEVNNNGN